VISENKYPFQFTDTGQKLEAFAALMGYFFLEIT